MKKLLGLLAVCIAVGVGLWFAGATATERVIAGWLSDREAEGWVVNYDSLDTTGFPTEFRTEFSRIILADPATGWVWTAPSFTLTQSATRPDRIRADWPRDQTLASPFERLTITSNALSAELDVQPTANLALDVARVDMEDLRVMTSADAGTVLRSGSLDVRRVAEEAAQYEVAFVATDLLLPEPVDDILNPAGLLSNVIALARYHARMTFDRPWDLTALETARPQITTLALHEIRADWGAMSLRASGDLEVDGEGRATGSIAIRAENWREMLDVAERGGVLPAGLRGAVETTLGFLAGLSGRAENIDASLRFDDGFAFFGPIPLGEAPRLVLR